MAGRELVNYEPYEAATLTAEGRERASRIAMRHRVVTDFLTQVLNVAPPAADRNARSLQHAVDEEVLEQIVCFLAFLRQHPECRADWLAGFRRFAEQAGAECSCEEKIRGYIESLGDDSRRKGS